MKKPFTWIVRMDVDPVWIADGGTISDLDALDMLAARFGWADCNSELQACVLAAPSHARIAEQQGYGRESAFDIAEREVLRKELVADAPIAYASDRFSVTRHVADLLAAAERINDDGLVDGLKTLQAVLTGVTPISETNILPGARDDADQ